MFLPSPGDRPVLLHNPRCSKSRRTKELLEERGAGFDVRLYLDEPLDEAELEAVAARLGRPLHEFVRTKESAFAEAGLSSESSDAELARAVAANPILMERPIFVTGDRAAIGRPPEDVLELL